MAITTEIQVMGDIKPALSSEQWKDAFASGYKNKGNPNPRMVDSVFERSIYEGDEADVAHYIAALALYGQPFGFTREDVKALRRAAEGFEWANRTGDNAGMGDDDAMTSLADRIEALLPPETK